MGSGSDDGFELRRDLRVEQGQSQTCCALLLRRRELEAQDLASGQHALGARDHLEVKSANNTVAPF